jgi:hypothetical protein
VDKILENYNVESDIATNATYLKMFLPISTLKTNKEAVRDYLVYYQSEALGITRLAIRTAVFDPLGVVNEDDEYVARVGGKHYFTLSFPILFTSITDVEAKVGGVQVATSYYFSIFEGFLLEVDLTIGDEVSFLTLGGSVAANAPIGFRCFNIEPTTIGLTSTVNPAYYLPNLTQSDFLKALCNIFGLVPDYDPLTETLRLWNINNLYDNKYLARDWSDYLSVENEELSFRLDYARRNNLKWKPDGDVGAGTGDASIIVNDANLSKEKDLYVLPFAFCDEVIGVKKIMARIGWLESVEGTAEYKVKDSITPRLVTREPLNAEVYITQGATNYTVNSPYAARSFPLDLLLSVGQNDAIVRMLRQSKVLSLRFNLPVIEVLNLDHSIPIYLNQYADYFFVKKVSNYIPEEICTVELIRLS